MFLMVTTHIPNWQGCQPDNRDRANLSVSWRSCSVKTSQQQNVNSLAQIVSKTLQGPCIYEQREHNPTKILGDVPEAQEVSSCNWPGPINFIFGLSTTHLPFSGGPKRAASRQRNLGN